MKCFSLGHTKSLAVPAFLIALSIACSGGVQPDELPTAPVRFAMLGPTEVEAPVWVMLNDEDGQIGWVTAYRDGERIFFTEQCAIEDCSNPGVVCGAAVSMVRRLDGRELEFEWDGMTSIVEAANQCERRVPAPAGAYTARFCYAFEAVLEGEGDPTVGVPGRLVAPVCEEVAFELDQSEVVFTIP